MSKITNTAKDEVHPEWTRGGNPDAIYLQEKRGQNQFVASDCLPIKGMDDCKKKLKKLGVKFLGPVKGDPLFQLVELPQGWEKVATEHDVWSHLLDENGKVRARIFYKAAFYDRKAFMVISE